MKFNAQSLEITSKRFSNALVMRELELPFNASLDVWAQLLFKKKSSAAMAEAKDKGFITAGPVSVKSIIAELVERNRTVDYDTAIAIFAEAIQSELPEIAEYFSRLPIAIQATPNACLIGALGDRIAGIGFIQGDIHGYLSASEFVLPIGTEFEMKWIRENSEIVVDVCNLLAGLNLKQSAEIYFQNHRSGSQKKDQNFIFYIARHAEEISAKIAKEVCQILDSMEREDWELEVSFDVIKDIAFDVIERELRKRGQSWLEPECNACNAVINNIAGSLRENLKMLSNDDAFYEEREGVEETLAHSAKLATRHIIGLQRGVSAAA